MNTLVSTALSGLNVAQTRIAGAANNIANLSTEGFRRDVVTSEAQPGGGLTAQVSKAEQAGPDLLRDLVDQKLAVYEFKANLQVLKTADRLAGSLLDTQA